MMILLMNRGRWSGIAKTPRFAGELKRGTWDSVVKSLPQFSRRLQGTTIEHCPYYVQLLCYNSPDCFIYLDPPYTYNSRARDEPQYDFEMGHEPEHLPLLDLLMRSRAKLMVSMLLVITTFLAFTLPTSLGSSMDWWQ